MKTGEIIAPLAFDSFATRTFLVLNVRRFSQTLRKNSKKRVFRGAAAVPRCDTATKCCSEIGRFENIK